MKRLLLIVLPLLMIVGCSKPVEDSTLINKDGLMYITDSDKPYTGEVFTNYSTGEKEYQGTYENGLLIQYSYLNKDGSIKEPVNIETLIDRGGNLFEINGQKPYTGDIFELYPNGNKKLSGSLKGGKFDGELIEYYSNGQMLIKEMYVGGVKNGSYNSWFENGQKESEETFKGGKQDGLWIRWNSDGVKIEEKTYKEGKRWNGRWTDNFRGSKQIKQIESYKDGKKDGLWTEWYHYHKKSNLTLSELFSEKEIDQQMKQEQTYKDGNLISKKRWNEDGSVKE